MESVTTPTTPYDGCGKCLIGVRRLSRKDEASNSPQKQLGLVIKAVEAVDGHIIGWADDWEVSGATNPLDRPQLGPWLRGKNGPYDGIAGAAVDRIGRNVRDVLNTAYTIHENGQLMVTADHPGVWDLDDPNQESELLLKALGAQLEHREIKRRANEETIRARNAGQVGGKPSYGYEYIRLTPNGKVDHVGLHKSASKNIRNVAERILADQTGEITVSTECARLTRAGALSPSDHLRVMYGREPRGNPWHWTSLHNILTNEAALGYLMHKGKPVLDKKGRPLQIAPGLWDAATRDALIKKTAPKPHRKKRTYTGEAEAKGLGSCGNCGEFLRLGGKEKYACTGRVQNVLTSIECKPAPSMSRNLLHGIVKKWFLAEYGDAQVMRKEFDPGTGYAARILELKKNRERLRLDRAAGLYEEPDDVEWYRTQYARMGREITELKRLPERPPGMRIVATGRTVAEEWEATTDGAQRRELLREFGVRIILFPKNSKERIKITGTDPYAVLN